MFTYDVMEAAHQGLQKKLEAIPAVEGSEGAFRVLPGYKVKICYGVCDIVNLPEGSSLHTDDLYWLHIVVGGEDEGGVISYASVRSLSYDKK